MLSNNIFNIMVDFSISNILEKVKKHKNVIIFISIMMLIALLFFIKFRKRYFIIFMILFILSVIGILTLLLVENKNK